MATNRILTSIYNDIDNWASFSSPKILYKAAKTRLPKLTLKQVETFLESQSVYTLHRRVRKRFKTRKIISKGLFYQLQADLIDVSKYAKFNNSVKFLLTVICVFSRRAYVQPLHSKTAINVKTAFQKVLKDINAKVTLIETDLGKEFYNSVMKDFFSSNKIKHFSVSSSSKSSICERFNRSVMSKIYKYFTAKNTKSYLSVLPRIVASYNTRPHRSLNYLAPLQVTKKNERKVWLQQYGDYMKNTNPNFKFKIHDNVRISKLSLPFKKGYLPTMTTEIFKIVDRLATNPPTYKLSDLFSEPLRGSFYQAELQRVSDLKLGR